jgi:fructose-1,6-bisphosphatase
MEMVKKYTARFEAAATADVGTLLLVEGLRAYKHHNKQGIGKGFYLRAFSHFPRI